VTKLPSNAGVGEEPPRHGTSGDQLRSTGVRAQRKNRREAEIAEAALDARGEAQQP
jgi:hypothetical protein